MAERDVYRLRGMYIGSLAAVTFFWLVQFPFICVEKAYSGVEICPIPQLFQHEALAGGGLRHSISISAAKTDCNC